MEIEILFCARLPTWNSCKQCELTPPPPPNTSAKKCCLEGPDSSAVTWKKNKRHWWSTPPFKPMVSSALLLKKEPLLILQCKIPSAWFCPSAGCRVPLPLLTPTWKCGPPLGGEEGQGLPGQWEPADSTAFSQHYLYFPRIKCCTEFVAHNDSWASPFSSPS